MLNILLCEQWKAPKPTRENVHCSCGLIYKLCIMKAFIMLETRREKMNCRFQWRNKCQMALFGNALEFPVLFPSNAMHCTANVPTDPSNRENYFVIWKVLLGKTRKLKRLNSTCRSFNIWLTVKSYRSICFTSRIFGCKRRKKNSGIRRWKNFNYPCKDYSKHTDTLHRSVVGVLYIVNS